MHRAVIVLAFCSLACAWGCGADDPLNRRAVSGTVTLDGTPLQQGAVSFTPQQQGGVASGAVIESGQYSIPAEKGLSKGKYLVAITSAQSGSAAQEAMPGDATPAEATEQIPEEWNTKSTQTVEVGDDIACTFNFDIKSKQ